MVRQYLDYSRKILTSEYSGLKRGSKEIPIISLFGVQNEYDLREGFPLLTTKRMFKNSMIHELLWFFTGDTNIKYLEDREVPIWRGNAFEYNLDGMVREGIFSGNIKKYSKEWDESMEEYGERIKEDDEFAKRWGDAGAIYGRQWKHWNHVDEKGNIKKFNQLGDVIEDMKKKPLGKRHLVSSWNHGDLSQMSLPPCHVMFQMTSNEDGEMDLQLYQRSCDSFLGVPFNLASYSMLNHIIAQEVGLKPRRFIHTFGDAHFYAGAGERGEWYKKNFNELRNRVQEIKIPEGYLEVLNWINSNAPLERDDDGRILEGEDSYDHITAILEQLSREPRKLPKLEIAKKDFDKLTIDDFKILDYDSHPIIKRKMAV